MTATNRIYETPDAPSTYSDHYLLVDKSGAVSATKVRIDAFKDWLLAGYTSGYVGGNIATLTNGTAAAGQKTVTVDSTTGFVAGGYAAYALVGGAFEYNLIATVTDPTHLLLTNNIGTGGIGDNVFVGLISPEQYASANAIPHAGTLVMPDTIEYANAGRFHVNAYGAAPGASQAVNTAAINAAIADAKTAGGEVQLESGIYATNGAINLCDLQNVTLRGTVAGQPGNTTGTIIECHNTGGAAVEIIGSANIELRDLQIIGHATDTPAVGIWTGRSNAAGGNNTSQIRIQRVQVYGAFSTAMLLNTGCESVQLLHCYVYPTSTACKAGWMFDWQNTIGLTPEHTGLSLVYPSTLCVCDRSFIVSGGETFTNYSPIYVVAEDGPFLRLSYFNAWGAPTIYLKGGAPAWAIDAEDSFSEGNPTYLIYCDYWDGTTGADPRCGEIPGAYCVGNTFRLKLSNFGGSPGSSGYSVYAEDDTTLRDTVIEKCGFSGNLRFYNVEGSRFQRWGNFSSDSGPTLTVAGYAVNSHFYVNYNDAVSFVGSMFNVTVDYDKDADSPSRGYLLLAGNKGLAIGGVPGATAQAVIRKMLFGTKTWTPSSTADGAATSTDVTVTGALPGDVCIAEMGGAVEAGMVISTHTFSDSVRVTVYNKSGSAWNPGSIVTNVLVFRAEET